MTKDDARTKHGSKMREAKPRATSEPETHATREAPIHATRAMKTRAMREPETLRAGVADPHGTRHAIPPSVEDRRAPKASPPTTVDPINIGEAATRSGVSAKMIRHYESLGLLGRVVRNTAGYRRYSEREVHTLRFIRRARDLGFSIAEIAELVKLWQNRRRASADVKRIALAHVADLERRIDAMTAMKRTLEGLAACCHGDGRPECPILEELSDPVQRG